MLKFACFWILVSNSLFASINIVSRFVPDTVDLQQFVREAVGTVVLWYGGERGLVEEGVRFYEPILTDPNRQAPLVLYDLGAWAALRGGIDTFQFISQWAWRSYANQNAVALPSAYFFSDLRDLNDETRDLIGSILQREDPYLASAERPFGRDIRFFFTASELGWLPERLLDSGSGRAYSALQYIEGLLLIRRFALQSANLGQTLLNLVFALPNDELRYYTPERFGADLIRLFMTDPVLNWVQMTLRVTFAAFRYGTQINDRPYMAAIQQ